MQDQSRAAVVSEGSQEVSDQMVIKIYENLVALLSDVSREKNAGLDSILAQYSVPGDVITSLQRSSQFRKPLVKLAADLGLSDDERFREALQKDDERLLEALPVVIHSEKPLPPGFTGDDAQHFLDILDDMPRQNLPQEHPSEALRMTRRLCEASGKYPSSMFITGVRGPDGNGQWSGGFADVFRASYKGKWVALKRLRDYVEKETVETIRLKFCREALVWKNPDHPNVLRLIGIDRDTFSPSLCMVLPWMGQGKIQDHLKIFGKQNVQKLLCDVAQGLQYLHSYHIVHGDLRGDNILITNNWTACLSDFGLSMFTNLSERIPTGGGNLRWMAPELIQPELYGHSDSEFKPTFQSDIYAFGCVCVELYTGEPPFSAVKTDTALIGRVPQGERPDRPTGQSSMSDTLWQYVNTYWAHQPESRPNAQTVVEHLTGLIAGGAN